MSLSSEIIRALAEKGDDFGFEVRVGKVLRSLPDVKITHGGLYRPLASRIAIIPQRQYDYRIKIENQERVLRLAVECKNFFPGSPVVVCGGSRISSESQLDMVASDVRIVVKNGRGQQMQVGQTLSAKPAALYPIGSFVGKTTLRPEPASKQREMIPDSGYKLTGDTDIFEEWNQAITHSVVLAASAQSEWENGRRRAFTVVLPLVVMPDEALWTIRYDEDGTIVDGPQKEHSTTLYVGYDQYIGGELDAHVRLSHIHLMTISGLRSFVTELANRDGPIWSTLFDQKAIAMYLESLKQPIYHGPSG